MHGGRIGVLVEVKGGSAELARGIAMHVAAMNPPYISAQHVPADFIAKEKEIELAKMSEKEKAKPAEILEKIISGKVNKIINENTLTGQPYVLDTNETVGNALKKEGAEVLAMHRLAVGEGIEKPSRRGLRDRGHEAGGSGLNAEYAVSGEHSGESRNPLSTRQDRGLDRRRGSHVARPTKAALRAAFSFAGYNATVLPARNATHGPPTSSTSASC